MRQKTVTLATLHFAILALLAPTESEAYLVREGSALIEQADLGEVGTGGDFFAWAMAVGDFDCDGFDDAAFGVPYKNVVSYGAGQVIVAYGSASGIPSARHTVFEQGVGLGDTSESEDRFGRALALDHR